MFCSNCGSSADESSKFCTRCGTQFQLPREETQSTAQNEKLPPGKKPKLIRNLLTGIALLALVLITGTYVISKNTSVFVSSSKVIPLVTTSQTPTSIPTPTLTPTPSPKATKASSKASGNLVSQCTSIFNDAAIAFYAAEDSGGLTTGEYRPYYLKISRIFGKGSAQTKLMESLFNYFYPDGDNSSGSDLLPRTEALTATSKIIKKTCASSGSKKSITSAKPKTNPCVTYLKAHLTDIYQAETYGDDYFVGLSDEVKKAYGNNSRPARATSRIDDLILSAISTNTSLKTILPKLNLTISDGCQGYASKPPPKEPF